MVSTTGPQALTFLNGAFVHQQAAYFASRLAAEAGPEPKDQVERAFALRLGGRLAPTSRGPLSSFSTSKSGRSVPKPPARAKTGR